MRATRRLLAPLLAALVPLAGCGGSSPDDPTSAPEETTPARPAATTTTPKPSPVERGLFRPTGEMTGEVTATSALLQTRLSAAKEPVDGLLPPGEGQARFVVATDAAFSEIVRETTWTNAAAETDGIIRTLVDELEPATRYHFRVEYRPDEQAAVRTGGANTFRTLPGEMISEPLKLAIITCMPYDRFHGEGREGTTNYTEEERKLGYPGLRTIVGMQPDYLVMTGDTVYYDFPQETPADDLPSIRAKYHRQLIQQPFLDLFARTPCYFQKDDHDYRFNDSDPYREKEPSHELGVRMFREQLPVTATVEGEAVTYRTHRVSRDVQIWLLEGRDHRSPNRMESDRPEKTIWGFKQRDWLMRTLLESDATFKLIISPTPILGPDFDGKYDNHANTRGFRYERGLFINWLAEHGFDQTNCFIVCGDLHWQMHSVHPLGIEEYGCGALLRTATRTGPAPGHENSSNRDGEVLQLYTQPDFHGGFMMIDVTPAEDDRPALITFSLHDEYGEVVYQQQRNSESPPGLPSAD